MKIFFLILILIFNFQSWAKADDISDFEIEGISIGDSALNFFKKDEIEKNSKDYFKKKNYTPVENSNLSFFKTFKFVDFSFKTGDFDYIIVRLSGAIPFLDNPEKCLDKLNEIAEEISELTNIKKPKIRTFDFMGDESGNSKQSSIVFELNSGIIDINCYDYSIAYGGMDHLSLRIMNEDYLKFLQSNPYK